MLVRTARLWSHDAVQERRGDLAQHRVIAKPDQPVTVVISGELDMSNAGKLLQWIMTAAEDHPAVAVEVDLQGVHYIDSTTIRTLVETRRRLLGDGRGFRVHGATGHVARVLKTTGVLAVLAGDEKPSA
ncbi:MAG TPA: STAS domain-containing protein [Candidatus Limnocylindrales bacterium]|nr:STAS domain-containing protein [Candidatus Limnocylindrales bacterium]